MKSVNTVTPVERKPFAVGDSGSDANAGRVAGRGRVLRGAAVLFGALLLVWPAVMNGYVLLNLDSPGYLRLGRPIAEAMLHPRTHAAFEARAEFYCLVVYLLHGGVNPWPIVALQALLTSYVLFLVVRSIVRRWPTVTFLAVLAVLSLMTGLSWQVSWVMTDILGPVAYLCLYLLVFGWEGLSRGERWAVAAIGWWCLTAHLTHLLLGGAVLALLAVLLAGGWARMRGRGVTMAAATGVFVFSLASLVGVHAYLYGEPTVGGYHPPYLMARVIADGPGRLYLEEHCPQAGLVFCNRGADLPTSSNEILWGPHGLWVTASADERRQVREQEMRFVLASVRAHPRLELRAAKANFQTEARSFGFACFVTGGWMGEGLDNLKPGAQALFLKSLQGRNALPTNTAAKAQKVLVYVSCAVLLVLLPGALRRGAMVMVLAAVVLPVVVENAFVCGVLSNIDDRLQNRVIWLIPLVAMLLVAEWLDARPQWLRAPVTTNHTR